MSIFCEGFLAGLGATLGYLTVMGPFGCCAYSVKAYTLPKTQ